MAPELSSNWKRLQATAKQEGKPKTKKPEDTQRKLNSLAKRKRLEDSGIIATPSKLPKLFNSSRPTRPIKRLRMGATGSAESAEQDRPSASLALWAEDNDISSKDLIEAYGVGLTEVVQRGSDSINAGLATDVEIGQYVAMDCEMVGVGGAEQERSVLARVSLVNFHGVQIYDSFVKPKEFVTDWRTHVSGVSTKDMATARSFEDVQQEIAELLKGRILVGHAIKHDLEAMMLGHSRKDIRDTSRFKEFRKYSAGKTPSLKKLAKEVLGVNIQGGEHSSIEDARATMLLYRRFKAALDLEQASRPTQVQRNNGGGSGTKKKKKKQK